MTLPGDINVLVLTGGPLAPILQAVIRREGWEVLLVEGPNCFIEMRRHVLRVGPDVFVFCLAPAPRLQSSLELLGLVRRHWPRIPRMAVGVPGLCNEHVECASREAGATVYIDLHDTADDQAALLLRKSVSGLGKSASGLRVQRAISDVDARSPPGCASRDGWP